MMRADSRRGSAPISALAVFIALLLAVGMLAALAPTVSQLFAASREDLRERGERGAELVRIYVHSTDETELGQPIITIINSHDRPSILTDYVVVSRSGAVLAAGKVGGSLSGLRLEPGERVDLRPSDLGLGYATFAAMADAVKAIYFRTSEGNSFGSSYGPPPEDEARVLESYSTTSRYHLEFASTTTSYNYSIEGTLPTLGEALVVKNVILVDGKGIVRGGALNGQRWSDGSFDPGKVKLSDRLSSGPDSVPLGGYYRVPDWWSSSGSSKLSIYKRDDTSPQYIEVVEIYPSEYFSPEGSAAAPACYARFAGEAQAVYNSLEGKTYTVTAQRPVRVQNYPYVIPGTYTPAIPATYTSYGATTSRILEPTRTYTITSTTTTTSPTATRTTTYTTTTCSTPAGGIGRITCYTTTLKSTTTLYTTITSRSTTTITYYTTYTSIVRLGTSTYTTTVTAPVTVWPESGLVKAAPVFDPNQAYDRRTGSCRVTGGYDSGKWDVSCGFTINPPSMAMPIAIKEAGYAVTDVWGSGCAQGVQINYVKVTGPWGSYVTKSSSWSMTDLPAGSVSFETNIHILCNSGGATLVGWVVYEFFWSGPTATATLLASDLRGWVGQAAIGTQLSGDAVASLAGTVQPGEVIKIKAPIVLLNYVYLIQTDPTDLPKPPRSGGGAGYGGRMECRIEGSSVPASSGGGGGGAPEVLPGVTAEVKEWVNVGRVHCRVR